MQVVSWIPLGELVTCQRELNWAVHNCTMVPNHLWLYFWYLRKYRIMKWGKRHRRVLSARGVKGKELTGYWWVSCSWHIGRPCSSFQKAQGNPSSVIKGTLLVKLLLLPNLGLSASQLFWSFIFLSFRFLPDLGILNTGTKRYIGKNGLGKDKALINCQWVVHSDIFKTSPGDKMTKIVKEVFKCHTDRKYCAILCHGSSLSEYSNHVSSMGPSVIYILSIILLNILWTNAGMIHCIQKLNIF